MCVIVIIPHFITFEARIVIEKGEIRKTSTRNTILKLKKHQENNSHTFFKSCELYICKTKKTH